jgi:two-component system chemotaxis response regulator CheY
MEAVMALNILVADDSKVARAMIVRTLRMAGLPIGEVYEASDGQEGLELLGQKWVDVVFVDINMPVMNGEEMIQKMRENPIWADLPLVVVSTEGSQTRIDRLQQKGAKFIHKPFTPEIVRGLVAEMTGVNHESSV